MVLFLVGLADLLGPYGLERARYEFVNEAEKTYHVRLLAMHLECLLIDPLGMNEEGARITDAFIEIDTSASWLGASRLSQQSEFV